MKAKAPANPAHQIRAKLDLDVRERAYRAKGNPLDAWFAYLTARECGLAVPEWVLRYFDAGAAQLRELCIPRGAAFDPRGAAMRMTLPRLRDRVPPDVRPAVARALGFTRKGERGNPFLAVDNDDDMARDLILAFAVDRCLRARRQRPGGQRGGRLRGEDDTTYETVAKEARPRTSKQTVARAWAKCRHIVQEFRAR